MRRNYIFGLVFVYSAFTELYFPLFLKSLVETAVVGLWHIARVELTSLGMSRVLKIYISFQKRAREFCQCSLENDNQ